MIMLVLVYLFLLKLREAIAEATIDLTFFLKLRSYVGVSYNAVICFFTIQKVWILLVRVMMQLEEKFWLRVLF